MTGDQDALQKETFFAKIVVVGESNAGKTSLLRAFCDGDFSSSYVSTIGVDFRIMNISIGNIDVKTHIWDSAGQERYKSLTASYFRGAAGILLCYDTSSAVDPLRDLQRWMDIIEKSADSNPMIMLVGTKIDKCQYYNGVLNQEYEDVLTRGEELAKELNISCTLTSSLNNINVKTPFLDVLQNLKDMDKLKKSTSCNHPKTKQYVSESRPDIVYLRGSEETLGAALMPGHGAAAAEVATARHKAGAKTLAACSCKACAC